MAIGLISTETLLLITDIILIIVVVYLLIRLRSKKKREPEKEERLADTPPPSRMTAPEAKLELLVPEEATGKKPQDAGLKAESPKNEEFKEALSGNPDEGKDKVQEELELEDRAPQGRPVDAEPKVSVENALKLEDDLPEDPSSLSTDAEPGAVEPEKAGRARKKGSRKKRAAKKGRKKKIAAEEGQAAGGEAAKEVLAEEKTEEGMPESKPLF